MLSIKTAISLAFFICVLNFVVVASYSRAQTCDPSKCRLPSCRCSGTDIPGGLNLKDTPQFVLLTFDDAVNVLNYEYYQKAFEGRKNQDHCPVSATFFISHEYTDYSLVHQLYKSGHEIALHSITHNVSTMYWQNISVNELSSEFAGERQMMTTFAGIPSDEIKGIRLPFLQMSGNNSFRMLQKHKFLYDCSWPSRHTAPGIWPYSLDYQSNQDCMIGPCPNESFPDLWVIPMLAWEDPLGHICSMVDACVGIPSNSVDEIFEFMQDNFNKTYYSNKAPFGFYVHAAWFNYHPNHFKAYLKFTEYLQTLPDVYMVGGTDVINWVKNPVPLKKMKDSSWSKCRKPLKSSCNKITCVAKKDGYDRYMNICGASCPKEYPWIGNPLGK